MNFIFFGNMNLDNVERLLIVGADIAEIVTGVVAAVVGGRFLWLVRDIILLLLLALIIASAMEPLVDYLHHKKIPRSLSVFMVYIVVLGLSGLVVILLKEEFSP